MKNNNTFVSNILLQYFKYKKFFVPKNKFIFWFLFQVREIWTTSSSLGEDKLINK